MGVSNAYSGAGSKNSNFYSTGATAAQNFVNGEGSKNSNSRNAGSTLAGNAISGAGSRNSEFRSAGINGAQGFVNGAGTKNSSAWSAGWNLAANFLSSIKSKLGIRSPSREARKLGVFGGKGFNLGIKDMFSNTKKTSAELATTSLNSMSKALSGMADFLSVDLDTMPTICPVMDLSEIQNGVSTIDKMFRATKGLDLSPVTMTAAKATSGSTRRSDDDSAKTPTAKSITNNFTQNNYSPKALSRVEIYRQTKNQFSAMERMVAT